MPSSSSSSSSSASLSSSPSSSSIPLPSIASAVERSSNVESVKKMLQTEPVSPQFVIPITSTNTVPTTIVPPYTTFGTGNETNFDHNDFKYHCCYGYMHITLAARIISIAYFSAILFIIFLTVFSQGVTLALYSIATSAFVFSIFGTLTYGIFKEKQALILPYIIFQTTSIVCTVLIIIIFIVGSALSNKILSKLAEDIGGLRNDDNATSKSDKQMFGLIFVIVLIILLFIQLWFMDVICRFRNFILERENSFALNLTSVLNENNEIFPNDLPPPFPYKGSIP